MKERTLQHQYGQAAGSYWEAKWPNEVDIMHIDILYLSHRMTSIYRRSSVPYVEE